MERIIDLHVHSTESDGTLSPKELVLAAKAAGLSAFALTDHDTVSGIAKAAPYAAQYGIELIPGIELSTEYVLPTAAAQRKEIHIVGLFIDTANPLLLSKAKEFQDFRMLRNQQMIEALQKEGFNITMEAVAAENPTSVITRANIARYLYEHGEVTSVKEVFEKYIGDGCKCYVGRFKITPMEAVSLIHAAGGVAVLAHPVLYRLNTEILKRLLDELKPFGLDAIEAVYATYTAGEERLMRRLAADNGLLISGGSDFHGANKPSIRIGVGRGGLCIPYEILEALRNARQAVPQE